MPEAEVKNPAGREAVERAMVRFTIDGREIEAPEGTTVIRAAHDAGIEVPYFCYHPGLTPEGNCRMCLVEVAKVRKPVPACVTFVTEGMEVMTQSPMAVEARRGVLELMLVNHPLDCPICDKSGECLLQDNTYNHGPDHSRMVELKELKPTKDLGSTIALWGNRCICCTRCVRFCNEVSGTGELTIVNRGDHSVVDVFDGFPLENPLAMNTVDICPVGALISKDFLYKARVWYLRKRSSICTACARGCNIEVQTLRNEIERLVPRHNPEVNDYWMCDHGRLTYKYVGSPDRLYRYRLARRDPAGSSERVVSSDPRDAVATLVEGLRRVVEESGPGAVAGVASTFMTLEELHCFREIFAALAGGGGGGEGEVGAPRLGALSRPVIEAETFPRFTISGDRNPNRRGVELILGAGALDTGLEAVKEGIRDGSIRGLILVDDRPDHALEEEWIELLGKLDFAAALLIARDDRLPPNASELPATAAFEKTGTMINEDGHVQRLQRAVEPPRKVLFEIETFQEVLVALGARERVLSPDGVFRLLGAEIPELAGKTLRDIGDRGLRLERLETSCQTAGGAS